MQSSIKWNSCGACMVQECVLDRQPSLEGQPLHKREELVHQTTVSLGSLDIVLLVHVGYNNNNI